MRRPAGFTLIELLAVVAIILLLASLLVPALQRARDMTLDARCKSNLRQIGVMMVQFAQDHEGVLPVGSVAGNDGDLDWQKCWMGKEVLPTGVTTDDQWPENRYGVLFPYMGNDEATARRLYRCTALEQGTLGSGYGSNGYFDYAMIMFWSGATLGYLPSRCELRYNLADPTTWMKKVTPLVMEEDPYYWLNRYGNVEPGMGNQDRLGIWHYGHGNYVGLDGSVQENRPLVPGQLNPELNNWYVTTPSGKSSSIGIWTQYGAWKDR